MTLLRVPLTLLVAAYVAIVVDANIGARLAMGAVSPDVLAVLAMSWVTIGRGENRFIAAAMIGLAADFAGPGRLGIGMACYLVAGYALQFGQERLAYHHPLLRTALVLPATCGLLLAHTTGRWLTSDTSIPLASVLEHSALAGIYTSTIILAVTAGWSIAPELRSR